MKKILSVAIIVVLAIFVAGSVQAAWLSNATIENVSATANGNYTVRAVSGVTSYAFQIEIADANAKALLAVVLTAISTTQPCSIEYSAGGIVERIILFNQ